MVKFFRTVLGAAVLCVCLALPSWGSERILRMDVEVRVAADASLTVTERIAFIAEGREIRRGLIRNIPVTRREGGRAATAPFRVIETTLDGRPVHYETRRAGRDIEVHLGDESFLSRGGHAYELTYRIDDQLLFFDDHDELYWNVTGNEWIFSIDKATLRVTLPSGTQIQDWDAYTGAYGSPGKDCRRRPDGTFETTRVLKSGEGFTVAVGWPKGFVAPPPTPPKSFIERHARFLFAVLCAGVCLWFFGAWWFVGRDPKRGVVIPLFEPPDGMEPALVGYVRNLRFDSSAPIADLIHLATLRAVTLAESDGVYSVRKAEGFDQELSPPLRAELNALFPGDERETVLGYAPEKRKVSSNTDASHLNEATRRYRDVSGKMRAIYGFAPSKGSMSARPPLVHWNLPPIVLGALLFIPLWWLMQLIDSPLFRMDMDPSELFVGAAIFGASLWFLMGFFGVAGSAVAHRKLPRFLPPLFTLCAVAGVAILSGGFGLLDRLRADLPLVAGLVAAWSCAAVFSYLMPARTRLGRMLLDTVEGFEMYLRTAEKIRLEALYPAVRGQVPELTPALFERFLPYAFVLGVAETWANAFAAVLEQAEYRPAWYASNRPFNVRTFGGRMRSMGSTAHNPGSGGSGLRGGGFSGGGRGGGGGRGR